MRNFIHLKFFSWILLVVLLTVMINGMHESAHAMQSHLTAASDEVSPVEISAAHHCPCVPHEQHDDYDCCDTCINCACHASLTIQPLLISYSPSMLALHISEPFRFLPEVYLSKFIPPQIHA